MSIDIPHLMASVDRTAVLSDYHQANQFSRDSFNATTQAHLIGLWHGKG
jgi:hypothetical protein